MDDSPKGAIQKVPEVLLPDEIKRHLRSISDALAEAARDGVFGVCQLAQYDDEGENPITAGAMSDVQPDSCVVVDLWRSVMLKSLVFAIQNFEPERLKAELAVAMDAAKESLE